MATEGEEALLADDLDLKELEMELDEDDYAYEEVEIERYDARSCRRHELTIFPSLLTVFDDV